MENTCRTLTLEEEIRNLDVDKETKERLLKKLYESIRYTDGIEVYLKRCHRRIDELEKALIEVACDFATRVRNMREEMS